jgi:predicted MFS family arabinose efflux permease
MVILQFGLGGLVLTFSSTIEGILGVYGLFFITATLVAIAIAGITVLPDYQRKTTDDNSSPTKKSIKGLPVLSLALLVCIFLFQSSIFGIWTYLERMAVTTGANARTVSLIVGNAAYLGLLGALIPVVVGNKFGRRPMIIGGIVALVVGVALLSQAHVQTLYIFSNIVLNIAWAATITYLLAAAAASEVTGRAAAASSIASKLGITAGPFISASVLVEGSADFTPVIVAGIVIAMLCMAVSWGAVGRLDRRALQQN